MVAWKKALALFLVLVCVFALAACGGGAPTDESMNNLEAIKASLTDKGYNVRITDGAEITIESQLEATNGDNKTVFITLFKTEQAATLYYDLMMLQTRTFIEQNEAEEKYYRYMLDNFRSDMETLEITQIQGNLDYIAGRLESARETVCVQHGKAVVLAPNEAAYRDCQ